MEMTTEQAARLLHIMAKRGKNARKGEHNMSYALAGALDWVLHKRTEAARDFGTYLYAARVFYETGVGRSG